MSACGGSEGQQSTERYIELIKKDIISGTNGEAPGIVKISQKDMFEPFTKPKKDVSESAKRTTEDKKIITTVTQQEVQEEVKEIPIEKKLMQKARRKSLSYKILDVKTKVLANQINNKLNK